MKVNEPQRVGRLKENPSRIHLTALFLCILSVTVSLAANHDWPTTGGDKGCTRYSLLKQITRKNVAELEVAWTYHTGDSGKNTTIGCTPIVICNVMFLTTANSKVV